MDWATSDLDPEIGVVASKVKPPRFFSTQKDSNKSWINWKSCLKFNPNKCATFWLQIDGAKKRWTMHPEPFLICQGVSIPSIMVSSFYKYLGNKIGIMSNTSLITDNFESKLENLTKALKAPTTTIFPDRTSDSKFTIPPDLHVYNQKISEINWFENLCHSQRRLKIPNSKELNFKEIQKEFAQTQQLCSGPGFGPQPDWCVARIHWTHFACGGMPSSHMSHLYKKHSWMPNGRCQRVS